MRKSIIPPPPASATFSPDGSTSEVEHLVFDLPGVSILEVAIDPARHNTGDRDTRIIEVRRFTHVGAVDGLPGAVVEFSSAAAHPLSPSRVCEAAPTTHFSERSG